MNLLKAFVADRDWLLAPTLRDVLVRLDTGKSSGSAPSCSRTATRSWTPTADTLPLFHRFPASVPRLVVGFFVDQIDASTILSDSDLRAPCPLVQRNSARDAFESHRTLKE